MVWRKESTEGLTWVLIWGARLENFAEFEELYKGGKQFVGCLVSPPKIFGANKIFWSQVVNPFKGENPRERFLKGEYHPPGIKRDEREINRGAFVNQGGLAQILKGAKRVRKGNNRAPLIKRQGFSSSFSAQQP